jgi:hypothetical protein
VAPPTAPTDLALGKPAVTAGGPNQIAAVPAVVDGNKQTQADCTDSIWADGAWCQIDFGAIKTISNINVVPGDASKAPVWQQQQGGIALGGYTVRVSNTSMYANDGTPAQEVGANPTTWSSHQVDDVATIHDHNVTVPAGVTGRYVAITQDSGAFSSFTLSELAVN